MQRPSRLPYLVALLFPAALVACGSSNARTASGTDASTGTGPGGEGGGDGLPDGDVIESDGAILGSDGAVVGSVGPDGSINTAGDDGSAPGGPVCTVASTGTSGALLSGTLLLPAGPTVGELLMNSAGNIVCAAASCSSAAGYAAATHIACPNGVISPALINAHDHTEYATEAPVTLPTTRFDSRSDWREGEEGFPKLPDMSTTDVPTIAAQELRFVLGGATSVLGSSGVAGLMRNLGEYKTPALLEGLTDAPAYFDTFPLDDTAGQLIASGCAYPSIETASSAFAGGGIYAPHVAEGISVFAENELTCTSLASNDLITSQTSIIHGVGVNANDVNVIATAKANLIWAPRSNISLYGDTAPVTLYDTMGVTIALGTDWLPSGSMNLLRELNCADTLNQSYFDKTLSDENLFDMVTVNAAKAVGFGSQIGTLAAGMVADVTVFDGSTNQGYRAVINASVEDVRLVLRGGTALYGDAPIVAALNTSSTCTALSVCGDSRTVCIDTPGATLAQIQAAAAPIYPLFFCRGTVPTSEPSCVPYRSTYTDGITATDSDGDGVPDATDDCPKIFNPPRLMDNGNDAGPGGLTKQSDVDGDGYGDVCDAKPLDPSTH